MADLNPRVLRDQFGKWVGKKVVIGTRDLHYVCGVVQAMERTELKVTVNGQLVVVPTDAVETIREAPAQMVEYVK